MNQHLLSFRYYNPLSEDLRLTQCACNVEIIHRGTSRCSIECLSLPKYGGRGRLWRQTLADGAGELEDLARPWHEVSVDSESYSSSVKRNVPEIPSCESPFLESTSTPRIPHLYVIIHRTDRRFIWCKWKMYIIHYCVRVNLCRDIVKRRTWSSLAVFKQFAMLHRWEFPVPRDVTMETGCFCSGHKKKGKKLKPHKLLRMPLRLYIVFKPPWIKAEQMLFWTASWRARCIPWWPTETITDTAPSRNT